MATTAGGTGACVRSDWVAFADALETADDHNGVRVASLVPTVAHTSSGAEASPLSVQSRSGWVQFDDKPWSPSPPPPPLPPQVKAHRNSVCSTASFWSSPPASESTQSGERNSLSRDASSSDLPSLNMEEVASQGTSLPRSSNSSDCEEDEGVNMDPLDWTGSNPHTNGQSFSSSGRFASWVTFDDDDGVPVYQHDTKPSNVRVDNLNNSPLQDANSNLIVSCVQSQRTDRHILDLTPEGTDSVLALDSSALNNSTPYTKKNPFLDKEFSNIQPSSINPFSAYFNNTELKSSGSKDSECPFTFSSSRFESPTADVKQERVPPDFASGHDAPPSCPPGDGLDHLRRLRISDPDGTSADPLPDDSVDGGVEEEPPFEPPHVAPRDGWAMLLRIPEKKNIMSSRHWGPIFVRLTEAGQLQLFYEKGLEKPFKEFQLSGLLELSEHKLQSYEESGRVHTLSLDQVVYREKRKIQPKVTVVHVPMKEQLVKLGTVHYQEFLSFRYTLQEKLATLPVDDDSLGSAAPYSEEEIHVEVIDCFDGVLSKGDGRILEQLVTTRVNVLAFLTGFPPCCVGLNDLQVKGKEVVSRHDIIPNTTTRWIRLRDCRLHDCVDSTEFAESRTITFKPPPGRRFELLRFRTAYAEKTLPFTLRTVVSIRGAEVELQSWLVMSSGFSSNRDPLTMIPCENVAVRYPIPEIWAKNFRREGVAGEKSLKARFNKGASLGSASSSGSEPAMRVTLGTAKYEQAFRAVVWRIGRLPDKNSAHTPIQHTHPPTHTNTHQHTPAQHTHPPHTPNTHQHTPAQHTHPPSTHTRPAHTPAQHTHPPHTRPAHTRPAHTPAQHTHPPSTHTRPAHTPAQHTHPPSTHTLPAHPPNTPPAHSPTPSTHTPNTHPQHTPTQHTHPPSTHTLSAHTPPAHSPTPSTHTPNTHTLHTPPTHPNTHPPSTHTQHTPSTLTHSQHTHPQHTPPAHTHPAHTPAQHTH
ncbi:stonin-2 isoform X2 [Brachyhypopomus gauderio]|uniref:stonin-2 isoform X2 n=1 Tax=Brachyhypopomus gauderio TaxID=698409 RepID=UPI0040424EBD